MSRIVRLARAGCVALMVASCALFALALPTNYQRLTALRAATDANEGTLTPANALALTHFGFSLPAAALTLVGLQAVSALVFVALALLIVWRKGNTWMGLLTALFLAVFGTASFPDAVDGLAAAHAQWWWPVHLLKFCGGVCLGLFIFLFPNGKLAPRWMWVVAAIFILQLLPFDFLPANAAFNNSPLSLVAYIGLIGIGALAQVYRYWRVSTLTERAQTKWFIVGFLLTVGVTIGAETALTLTSSAVATQAINPFVYYLTVLLIPASITVAILRSHLWDIDILIRRTLIYGSLTAMLAAIYFGIVVGLQPLTHLLTGQRQQNPIVIVLTTLLIAALFQPLRSRVQRVIDRRFYRSRYNASQLLAEFSGKLRTEVELDGLQTHLVSLVEQTMRPAHISLWLRAPSSHTR